MDFAFVSHFRAMHTITWAVLLSFLIIAVAATLGRATVNLRGALTAENGSLAVMLLLPDDGITDVTLVKAGVDTQEFLAEGKNGQELVRLKKGENGWYVQEKVMLRE